VYIKAQNTILNHNN